MTAYGQVAALWWDGARVAWHTWRRDRHTASLARAEAHSHARILRWRGGP